MSFMDGVIAETLTHANSPCCEPGELVKLPLGRAGDQMAAGSARAREG